MFFVKQNYFTFLTEKAFFPCIGPMMFIKKNQNIVFLLEIRK